MITVSVRDWMTVPTDPWHDLVVRSGGAPFADPWYLGLVDRVCAGDRGGCAPRGRVACLEARRAGLLSGVLPIVRRGPTAQAFSLAQDREPALVADGDASAVALMRSALELAPLRLSIATTDGARDLAALGRAAAFYDRRVVSRPAGVALGIEIADGFDAYYSSRARKLRRDLDRCWRRLAESGAVEFTVQTNAHGAGDTLEECLKLEDAGWKGRLGSSILASPGIASFYRELVRWAAESGHMRLMGLRVDGELVAWDLAIRSGERMWFLKGAYDESWSRSSPGLLLLREGLRAAVDDGVTRFELLGSDEAYKRRWATHERTAVIATAFASGALGASDRIASRVSRRAGKRAKARVTESLRGARARLGAGFPGPGPGRGED